MNSDSNPAPPKKLFALSYKYVEDMEEKRAPVRAAHLDLIQKAAQEGKCKLGGAFINPVDSGFLLFETEEQAREFVAADPYNEAGLITEWSVREYVAVCGLN
eukprot:CAMPEP_0113939924 /NCGR_PEP_ID=MMETSP1339-20121228/6144_1 /TAXON_ID=94617 /ORGANISM="Fibrocapsa japonica" /LENGTH=101 /DNA_ID=CAMNT_0000943569 /DNA_START=225 /DNA_END=530 /DNA_ORIENTATION=- /assembly_acc=CAM_ASM_000762